MITDNIKYGKKLYRVGRWKSIKGSYFGQRVVYLVLSSLYESFITPLTILLALPFALCGGFLALYLGGQTLNIFGFLGVFLLLGVVGKNSILLIDFALQSINSGISRTEGLIAAEKARICPILMTSFALIVGTIPVAIGINEASKSRTIIGHVVIGGLITSTFLTLIVVPVAFTYIDNIRLWFFKKLSCFLGKKVEVTSVLQKQP
ncbi:MAG: efflux RND transporter permease subunit [Oligoflexia bacterium]|nr:efflux RND transporter permease subunit [Oligoflexia bacterium]